jgi:TatD DNase family protein
VHSREAAADTLELMRRYRPRGVVHCFSGSAELAKIYADMGYYVGFTGVVTFEKARRPLEAARAVPLQQLLIETDCPYMAPAPYRGKRSDSTMLPHVVNALAAARGETPEAIAAATWKNAREIYNIN